MRARNETIVSVTVFADTRAVHVQLTVTICIQLMHSDVVHSLQFDRRFVSLFFDSPANCTSQT